MILISSLLVGIETAIELGSTFEHQIALIANNNTIVGSRFQGVSLRASGDSTMTADLNNNVIVGSQGIGSDGADPGGFGIVARINDQAVIDLVNGHNLLFDNAGGDYGGIATPGPGDLFVDPLFVDPVQGDYRLSFGSPAVDAGDNDPPGGLEGFDLDLGPRILDGDLDGVEVVDLGAYEGTTEPPAIAVPALSVPALIGFAALLGAVAAWRLRRKPVL